MNNLLDLLISTLTQGLVYALLSYGVYITYKILDFPDLTVDGSFPLGAAVTAVMMTSGFNPWLTLPASLLAGALAGLITGVIHVRFKVRDLRKLIVSLLIVILAKVLLDLYFKTKSGLLLRAVGDNSVLVTSLAKDKGTVKIVGLVISNSLVALSGSIVCHEQRAFSSTMGTGQVVFGLATVIIGATIFQKFDIIKGTTAALIGSIIYKACMQLAISLGLPANLLKLITAVLFLAILIFGNYQKKKAGKNIQRGASHA
jgi:putative ABC transport system permease protein